MTLPQLPDGFSRVTILSVTLLNFKKHKELHLTFDPTKNVIIGANGVGKTTIVDAWYYLWTGYDTKEQADYEIKTKRPNGEVIPRLIHAVQFEIQVEKPGQDAYVTTLRKELHEKWKPKSDEDPTEVFEKNFFVYKIDGGKLGTEKAFIEKLNEICPIDKFRTITNPHGYLLMKKQEDSRKQIVALAGEISDADLVKAKPEYEKLVDILKRKRVEDYKKEVDQNLSAAEKDKAGLPNLITENNDKIAALPSYEDFEKMQLEITAKMLEVEELDTEIASKSSGEEFKAFEEKKNAVQRLKNDFARFKSDFQTKLDTENASVNAKKIPIQGEIDANLATISKLEKSIALKENQILSIDNTLAGLLKKWNDLDATEFEPPAIPQEGEAMPTCTFCGKAYTLQDLVDKMDQLEEGFNAEKVEKLEAIGAEGDAKDAEKNELTAAVEESKNEISRLLAENVTLQEKLDLIVEVDRKIEDEDAYKEFVENIAAAELSIAEPPKANDEELKEKKRLLNEEIALLNQSLGKKAVLDSLHKRVKELVDSEDAINKEVLKWKKVSNGVLSYMKDRSQLVEDKVNSMFKHVKFELFKYNNDGTPKLDCIPTVGGVYYKGINPGSEATAIIDVANTFSEKEKIILPVFLDGTESVADELIPETPAQLFKTEFDKSGKYKKLTVLN